MRSEWYYDPEEAAQQARDIRRKRRKIWDYFLGKADSIDEELEELLGYNPSDGERKTGPPPKSKDEPEPPHFSEVISLGDVRGIGEKTVSSILAACERRGVRSVEELREFTTTPEFGELRGVGEGNTSNLREELDSAPGVEPEPIPEPEPEPEDTDEPHYTEVLELTDISGVGPGTADKIRSAAEEGGVQSLEDFKAFVKTPAFKSVRGVGRKVRRSAKEEILFAEARL